MPTQLHTGREPDASLPKADEEPEVKFSDARLPDFKQSILELPSGTTAKCDIVFLAMIIPFPILITNSPFSSSSYRHVTPCK